ncbi:RNA polymerase sigma factor [Chitinispirillales bacterium ANBcel5]|uniref:RNA polymerase sigma factor n=1 Tax=Cellulosispirillum alkaliphilum TaxID=3039283 RepID=UPI002A52E8C4|nr:RNA polymerase sigma factor [Chitinispirillales bacterium ANBcel5]
MQEKEFRAVYNTFAGKVYTFILWLTQSRSSADDILQEVFLKVWRSDSVPKNEEEQLRWLYSVARNATVDHFRKSNRFSKLRQNFKHELLCTPRESAELGFEWEWVEELAETEKAILYLHLRDGYTYREIAEILDLKENNVRIKAFRALKLLRNKLKKKEL